MSILALIHPTDLLGVELRQSLDRRRDLWHELRLFSTREDEIGSLTEVRGAAAIVQQLEPGSLEEVDVAFLSAKMAANRDLVGSVPEGTAAVILSPDASPSDGYPIVAGVNLDQATRDRPLVSPHPATIALAHLLHPLLGFEPRSAVATLLQPVSMHDKPGLDEMFDQTRSILSFDTDPPRGVFPVQMVFNLVPALSAGQDFEGQLRTVLGREELAVSVHLLQAGVFHSFGATLYVELAEDPGLEAVRDALAGHPMNELAKRPDLLGPIDAAARDEVLIGHVESLGGSGRYRLWAVMDNLTCGGAMNALQILEAISRQVTH